MALRSCRVPRQLGRVDRKRQRFYYSLLFLQHTYFKQKCSVIGADATKSYKGVQSHFLRMEGSGCAPVFPFQGSPTSLSTSYMYQWQPLATSRAFTYDMQLLRKFACGSHAEPHPSLFLRHSVYGVINRPEKLPHRCF
jgi:hypothetical protein